MNDSHYHKPHDTDIFVEYPGTQFDCPICHPERKAKPVKVTPVTQPAAEPTGKPNLLKHATNPPVSRKNRI